MNAIPLRYDEISYPESDGQPMGETELHRDEIVYLIEAFRERFETEAGVHVSGDLFFYYRQGDPKSVVSGCDGDPGYPPGPTPDLQAVGGRDSPCLVVEVTSESTVQEDLTRKKALYERLGVDEYVLYDPLAEALNPPDSGFSTRGRTLPEGLPRSGWLTGQPHHRRDAADGGGEDPACGNRQRPSVAAAPGAPGRSPAGGRCPSCSRGGNRPPPRRVGAQPQGRLTRVLSPS